MTRMTHAYDLPNYYKNSLMGIPHLMLILAKIICLYADCLYGKCGGLVLLVNLSDKNISSLDEILEYRNLLSLEANNNTIYELPNEIGNLKRLNYLSLENNELVVLPNEIGQLIKLGSLFLGRNQLIMLPDSIGNLSNMHRLKLNGNELSMLPDTFGNLKSLRYLNIKNNKLQELPQTVDKLTKLQTILATHNMLTEIPDMFDKLKLLTNLDLGYNKLTKLPNCFDNFRKLNFLKANNNELIEIPNTIGKCTNLIEIDFSFNCITHMPDTIGDVRSLSDLNISRNNITSIPSSIGNLIFLLTMKASNNMLQTLPNTIGDCVRLQSLYLDSNLLRTLPTEISKLQSLRILDVSKNNLCKMPTTITDIKSLRKIDWSSNNLNTLPVDFATLRNLTYVYLNNNNLTNLPIDMGNLKKLEILSADNNNIQSIPTGAGYTKNLKFLNLKNNCIRAIPKDLITELQMSEKFQLLDLRNNPLQEEGNALYCGKRELYESLKQKVMFTGYFTYLRSESPSQTLGDRRNIFDFYNAGLFYRFKQHENKIVIDRDNMLESTVDKLMGLTGEEALSKNLSISFYKEVGLDLGGLKREWLGLVSKAYLQNGLFTYVNEEFDTVRPSYKKNLVTEDLKYYECFGRLMAISIVENVPLDIKIDSTVYKWLLGKQLDLEDYKTVDKHVYDSFCSLINDPIDDLELYFAITEKGDNGQVFDIDLIPNGSEIKVTDENKKEYVEKYINYKLVHRIEDQLVSIKKGLYEVFDQNILSVFDEKDLSLIVYGTDKIDIQKWKSITTYSKCSRYSQLAIRFWIVVESFTDEQRALLLHFATGMRRIPSSGPMRFVLMRAPYKDSKLPTAHTCNCQLDLPEYETYEMLEDRLLYAIENCTEGFQFV